MAKSVPTSVVDLCKHDVLQYQSSIELVRKSLGDKAANKLAAKFMSKAEWDTIRGQVRMEINNSLK